MKESYFDSADPVGIKRNTIPSRKPIGRRAEAMETMRKVMKKCGHLTFRGKIYKKHSASRNTYVPFTNPTVYIDKWLKIPQVGPLIAEHDTLLKTLLGNTENPICEEVEFVYDLIEVSVLFIQLMFALVIP